MVWEFKYSENRNWKYYYSVLLKLLIITMVVLLIYSIVRNDFRYDLRLFLILIAYISIIHVFPLTYLFFTHRQKSLATTFILDGNTSEYTIETPENKFSFKSRDIIKVRKIVSPPYYDNRIDWLLIGIYHYWIIELACHRDIIISCLIVDEERIFDPQKIKYEKKVFPSLPKSDNTK